MGQKIHPLGFRLGITKGWESNWFGGKKYADKILEDEQIREYIQARVPRGGISRIIIERVKDARAEEGRNERITITVQTSRPGIIIGKGGQEVDKIKEELKKITKKDIVINIFEIKVPELDAKLVADNIAQQLEARISYRRAMKNAIASTIRMGAEGVRILCSGRLAGSEIARSEQYKEGSIPLQTLRADIDFARSTAHTVYGTIGVKVWICRGGLMGKLKADFAPRAASAPGAPADSFSTITMRNKGDKKRGGSGGRSERKGKPRG